MTTEKNIIIGKKYSNRKTMVMEGNPGKGSRKNLRKNIIGKNLITIKFNDGKI